MTSLESLALGIVEGVTEYLPVSSTGHLILAQRLMGIDAGEASDAFAICIQAGAILAVLGLYLHRVREVGRGLLGRDAAGLRLAINLSAAFLPAAVIGILFEKKIKALLFNLPAISAAWLVGGLAILLIGGSTRFRRGGGLPTLEALTPSKALLIGFVQCLAMWPGTSRSLVTLIGGILVGLEVSAAVEFSFLLGVVTLTAATAHDLWKHGDALFGAYPPGVLAFGFVGAVLSAAAAVKWMIGYLRRHSLAVFGWYRLAVGSITGVLLLAGWITG
jgi:undecaprenyl-diphosphatase